MTRRIKGKFFASIRLVPDVDTIGIPIFMSMRGNEMLVPEMDGDFRIVEFTEFYNEHGYTLAYDIPAPFHGKPYAIGSATPIPFWIENACHVIPGDADRDEPTKVFGPRALDNPVLADISRLLDDARSGRIAERSREWVAENIANSFSGVFHETPNRSRYWVSRYRRALAHARKLAKPPHPIDNKLREVAGNWLRRFGSKTDIRKLAGILGSSSQGVFSKRQMTDILFAFLMSKLAQGATKDIDTYLEEPNLLTIFPHGLYHHYLAHGAPRVPFHYNVVDDINTRMMDVLSDGHEVGDFRDAAKLALLLYGRGKVPEQVEYYALTYILEVQREFGLMRAEAVEVLRDPRLSSSWREYAVGQLELYDQMMDLDGILVPTARGKRIPFDGRFGVSLKYLRELKTIARKSRIGPL